MIQKIITIIGARPQFIKAASVSKLLRKNEKAHEIVVHTGQHYDDNMSDIFFRELEMHPPHYSLNSGSDTHARQTAAMLGAIEEILTKEKPDWLLIYGDTNSTLAGALAASKLHIPIAHVEAGLRSFNRKMPEEINRIVADHLSQKLFAPTQQAVLNLKKEGFDEDQIIHVGDVMFDAALYYGQKAESHSSILQKHHLTPKKYILSTLHRAENTDNPERLKNLFQALLSLSLEIDIVLPLHPRTRKYLNELFENNIPKTAGIKLIEPVGFLDMVMLEKNAALIATDSGGVQKEAFFYQVPCVTLREETEWVELVELGWSQILRSFEVEHVVETIKNRMFHPGEPQQEPYGAGNAAELILQELFD